MEISINWIPIIVAALIPMVIGAIYYGPIFGRAWMSSLGITEEDLKDANMAVIYGVALVLSFLLSMGIDFTIEFTHIQCSETGDMIFGSYHTFKHGMLHGVLLAICFAVPVLVNNSLFQRNSAKNILINLGYWVLTFAVMGGLLDVWR